MHAGIVGGYILPIGGMHAYTCRPISPEKTKCFSIHSMILYMLICCDSSLIPTDEGCSAIASAAVVKRHGLRQYVCIYWGWGG